MKKKPEQYTRAGKSNVTLRNFLNNLKENDLHFENNQITQCVFLGVLRLKPVPTIFSSNNTSSDCSSIVESKPRRFRNNNSNKEGNKNISRKKDINKVLSGKIRKKNSEKIKASVKKVPLKKPIINVKLNMKKKTPNNSPSKEANTPNSDIIEDSLTLPSSPPTFNPVDNLFSKLKQQIEHSQPGPSGVLPHDVIQTSEQTSVCKISVNRQLGYSVKSKKSKKLGKKKSIIHERLAMPLLPGSHESVTSSESSGFKEDLMSSSSHTSSSPISEQDLTTTTDVIVVSTEAPKVSKQKERTSPRNKGESKAAANDEEIFWINGRPMFDMAEDDKRLGNDVIVIPDNVAEVPYRNSSSNDVIVIDETRGPRLSPRSKKTIEKTQETISNEPNINSRPISKLTTAQSGEKSRSDLSAHTLIFDVEQTIEKQTITELKTVESTGEGVEAEKPFDKPRRRRRLMPTAIPSIFFNTPMLLRSELAQKKTNAPEKKPVARGLSRLLRSELNKQEKPPKARNNSQMTEETSTLKLSKPPQKNYKQNDNLIYEVVKPVGLATTHSSNLSESSTSSANEVVCLDDAPPKVEPLIIKLKVQQKNFETAPKGKGTDESPKEKRNIYENSDSISLAPEKSLLKPQVSQPEDTKIKETVLLSPKLKNNADHLVKPAISAEKISSFEVSQQEKVPKEETTVLPVKNYETVKIDTSDRKNSPKVASPKKPIAKVSPKPIEINLVQEKKQETEVATKNVAKKEISIVDKMKLTPPEKLAVKVSPKPVEEKVQKAIEIVSNNSGNQKDISIAKLRENTRRLLRPEKFCSSPNQTVQKTVDPSVIIIPDETKTSSDSIDVINELPSQKAAVVTSQCPKEAKSKYFKMLPPNQFQNKNDVDQELSRTKSVPEIIDLCSADQTDAKESKKSSELEKRITIHSDFKLQFMKNEEPQCRDKDRNWNTIDNINGNPKDINKNVGSKDISKIVNSKDKIDKDCLKNVGLKEKSNELEEVKFIPKTTRSSVTKEQLVMPKTELSDKNIEANIIAPIEQLAEKVKTEHLDSPLEKISEMESKRTLRSEMVQPKSALPPAKAVEIKKPTEGPLDQIVTTQKSLHMSEITKTSPVKPSGVGASKLTEIPVANTVISEKVVEKAALNIKEPEVAELPQKLLRSNKCQQKLLEDKNKNILPDSKIKTPKSNSFKQAKKTTAQPDLSTQLSKKIHKDIETLQNDTDKESPKIDRLRSSISQKSQKQENLDEIIVLSDKKAKKTRESTTRLLRSSIIEPLFDSEPTTIKSEKEKVVVLIHDEPKIKQGIADSENSKENLKGEALFPRSLRSQKTIADGPPVKSNRKGRKPGLSVGKKRSIQDNKLKTTIKNKILMGKKSSLQDSNLKTTVKNKLLMGKKGSLQGNKLKTAIKNKPLVKTHTAGSGIAKQNNRSKTPKVLTKNGAAVEKKKKIPITKKVTRQKTAQPLRRLRQRAVANVPKKEWLPAKARADKLQKQLVAKNKKAPKGKKSVEWKNNEIIEKIIQEIRNTIFQDGQVEDNLQLEGNISSEENSPKENIVPAKKKIAEAAKVSNKKKKVRRPSLKEIRNTRANLQRGHYRTRQGNLNAKTNPKLRASKRKLAETTSKRASQRVAQKVTKEDSTPQDPSPTTVDSKKKEIEVPKNIEPTKESEPCRDQDEAYEADNKLKNTFNDKGTYQMVNSYLEEIVENEEDKTHQLKRKSEDLEHEVVARKQFKMIPEEIEQGPPQLNQVEATVSEVDATVSKVEATVSKAVATVSKVGATVSRAEAKVSKVGATVSKTKATVSKAETTVSKAEATVPKAEATVSKVEVTVSKAEATLSKVEVTVPKTEATVSKAETTAPKAEATVSKVESTLSKPEATVSEAEATVSKAKATVSKAEATVSKAEATVCRAEATVVQAEGSTAKAGGKATKRQYKKRTLIKSVKESPAVDVEQSSSQLNVIKEENPSKSVCHMETSEREMHNGEGAQSVKTDEVKQDDGQVEEKRQCKTETENQCETEFVRILKKLVKEMLPTEDLQQSCPELDQARSSNFDANATKMVDVIKRLCVDNEEKQVPINSEVLEGSSKKADITVFDFDESEPEVAPLRQKASPEKPTVAGKDKMWTQMEQPVKEVAKKVQRRPKIKLEIPKIHDVSQISTNSELKAPKKMWSRIEKPTEEVAKKAHRRPNTKEDYTKSNDESKTSSGIELEVPKKMWSRIEVPTEMKPPPAPKNKPRKSLEAVEAAESPQGSPTKATSPMKQPTIIEMFNKVRLKLGQGSTDTDTSEDPPVANRAAPVATQSRDSIEEANFSGMPPPKMERANCKPECMEDDDSDCESRAEWIPEEYAEYKMKYSAQKMMQYKPVFKCKVCLKVFPSYYRLTKHRREHELTDNPYVCRQCEADFSDIDELTAHLRVHKGKYPYTCSKCSVGFWTKKAFDAHAPIHVLRKLKPPVKKFRCDVCAKEFSKLCDIDRHMRVHTGEKPCICNICNKGFQQSHNLSKHLLTHLHIRPFHCEICDKQFGRGDVLARHVLTHSIDKPIKCWVCYKGFIRQTQLAQHHQKYHRDQPLVKPEPDEDVAEEVA